MSWEDSNLAYTFKSFLVALWRIGCNGPKKLVIVFAVNNKQNNDSNKLEVLFLLSNKKL